MEETCKKIEEACNKETCKEITREKMKETCKKIEEACKNIEEAWEFCEEHTGTHSIEIVYKDQEEVVTKIHFNVDLKVSIAVQFNNAGCDFIFDRLISRRKFKIESYMKLTVNLIVTK